MNASQEQAEQRLKEQVIDSATTLLGIISERNLYRDALEKISAIRLRTELDTQEQLDAAVKIAQVTLGLNLQQS